MTLSKLKRAQKARITQLPSDFFLSGKLIEQGFVPNSEVYLAHKAPFNGPMAFYLHGTKVCIQQNIAALIQIEVY